MKILVLGGTGMLGAPVVSKLLEDGFEVRLLARDVEKAQKSHGDQVEIVPGDVTQADSLKAAMQGCKAVHLSVGGAVDLLSAQNVASLAPEQGVEQVGYLSGSTVSEQNRWFHMTAQKLQAESALRHCAVPTTIFCPTWPMEQLPRFVMGGRATLIGIIPEPWHWFAAEDLARMVSNAYQRPSARGKRLYIHGPEGITVKDALTRYCRAFHPEIEEVSVMPIEAAKALAESTGNVFLKNFALLMEYFKKVGEPGDPSQANELLGAPTTTLDQWIAAKKAS